MDEILTKVEHDLDFASEGLRLALQSCTALESIVILPIIKHIQEARLDVAVLISARKEDVRG